MPLLGETPPGSGDWDAPPAETSIDVFADVAPGLGEAFGQARDRDELLFGFAEHSMSTTYLGSSTGLRLRHDQPTGKVELNGKSADFSRSVWAGTGTRDFSDVSIGDLLQLTHAIALAAEETPDDPELADRLLTLTLRGLKP